MMWLCIPLIVSCSSHLHHWNLTKEKERKENPDLKYSKKNSFSDVKILTHILCKFHEDDKNDNGNEHDSDDEGESDEGDDEYDNDNGW